MKKLITKLFAKLGYVPAGATIQRSGVNTSEVDKRVKTETLCWRHHISHQEVMYRVNTPTVAELKIMAAGEMVSSLDQFIRVTEKTSDSGYHFLFELTVVEPKKK